MLQLVSSYHQSHLGEKMLAYDGRKNVYAAGSLPFSSKEFVIKLSDDGARWCISLFIFQITKVFFTLLMFHLIAERKENLKFQSNLLARLTFINFNNSCVVNKLMLHKIPYKLLMWSLGRLHPASNMNALCCMISFLFRWSTSYTFASSSLGN